MKENNYEENLINADNPKISIEDINEKTTSSRQTTVAKQGTKGGTVDLSEDCTLGPDVAPSDLLKDIININPTNILEPLLTLRKSCFKKLTVENCLKWQKKEIDEPLLRMEDGDAAEASKQIFRNLLSYMGDRKSSKKPYLHARKIISLMLKFSFPILKDEVFLQIYKQLHGNKKFQSYMRGWKMMAILASCFVPSNKDIYYLILNYLFFEMQNVKDPQVINHIKYIFVRMIRMRGKERHHIPSEEELTSIERLVPIELPVKFFSGNMTNVKVESYTTIGDLKIELMNRLDFNVQRAIYYSIYEICETKTGTEERFIDDGEKVCDILSVWESDKAKAKSKGEECKFHLYLKLLVYYPFEKDDIDTVSVVYYQTAYDVLTNKHEVDERKIINLAAYKLVVEFGDDEDVAEKKINDSIHKYIPKLKFGLMHETDWKEKILDQYKKENSIKKEDAKWNYIQELKNLPTYEMQQFNAKFNYQKSGTNEDEIPDLCTIGLKPDGIMIMNREHNEIVFYKYETIMNWGISKNQLILCISVGQNEIKRSCFITSQTKVIQALIEIYCNLLVGKTIKDIQEVVKNYDEKFAKIDTSRRKISLMTKDEADTTIIGDENEAEHLTANKTNKTSKTINDTIDADDDESHAIN